MEIAWTNSVTPSANGGQVGLRKSMHGEVSIIFNDGLTKAGLENGLIDHVFLHDLLKGSHSGRIDGKIWMPDVVEYLADLQ